ncbi:hypothetical protein JL49_08190 [Pseudoalteromonas luteoviolacea]|nr:hypothetical protein JL49_08190 [Pseudoalteromonas luteoviolacea]
MLCNKSLVETSMLLNEYAPKCDMSLVLIATLKKAVDDSPYSRPAIVDRMNEALGGKKAVTVDMLNKWLSPGAERKMPAEYITAFCWATQSIGAVAVLLQPIDFVPVDERGVSLQRAAELILQSTQLQKRAEQMFMNINGANSPEQRPADVTSLHQ